jgi:hypothetical protein
MCAQLDLEVMSKRFKEKRRISYFHKFWNKEVHNKRTPKKKKSLMFECYNLLDPME